MRGHWKARIVRTTRQRRVYRRMYTLSETRNEASHRLASSLKSRGTQVVPAITASGHKVDLCGHRAISKTLRYISLRVYFWTTINMRASLVVRVCIDKPQGIRNFQENESEREREREREEEVPPWSDHSGHGAAWETFDSNQEIFECVFNRIMASGRARRIYFPDFSV